MLIHEQIRRYNEKMDEIEQLEYAETLAVNQLKLKRNNTVRAPLPTPHPGAESTALSSHVAYQQSACRLKPTATSASNVLFLCVLRNY